MTYYEWISCFDKLKTGPRNDELLKTLYNSTIELKGNILFRFINQINDLVRVRLKNSLDSVLLSLNSMGADANLLSLEIVQIKKELIFAKNIINLPVIPEENKNEFKKTLQKFANEIDEALTSGVSKIDHNGEMLLVIKNNNIKNLED